MDVELSTIKKLKRKQCKIQFFWESALQMRFTLAKDRN